MYIPPHQSISQQSLINIVGNTCPPILISGDFNSWSTLWGSAETNSRGKILENFILNEDLIILNNGSPTHFTTHKTFTHIDITLCSSQLAPLCAWKTLHDLYGSDHFPIHIRMTNNFPSTKPNYCPKFKLERANWTLYNKIINEKFAQIIPSDNINQQAAAVVKCIRSAANISIPQTKNNKFTARIVWWNHHLDTLRSRKQRLWHTFKRVRTDANLIEYKKCNALFRKAVKISKENCLKQFTSNINPTSTSQRIWNDIKKISGGNSYNSIKHIKVGTNILSNQIDIANHFEQFWSNLSATNFRTAKANSISHNYNPTTCNSLAEKIEVPINEIELETALSLVKGKTPGGDRISYPMLKPNTAGKVANTSTL
ncbi:RNA-directed DNA polymerase from mobile element jockey [Eumeta japonica]|uniref:RNA-directed DNA polymerase from mobile element jockey n=1 Tax=Eumeta variegata TaxID=151549 RepID=A0A4C1SVU0_EUMVA|nr:RNA-directed DNA polymerase from mobile element jockey [Eumeta japonica]